MNKTPEELAKEYCNQFSWNDPREEDAHDAFLAGYQAAKDEYEAKLKEVSTNWTFCCEDKARLLQEIAAASPMPVTIFPTSGQWISVKERLPEEDVDVAIGWFSKTASNKTFWTTDAAQLTNKVFSGWREYPEATHWMPLPAAPKDEA